MAGDGAAKLRAIRKQLGGRLRRIRVDLFGDEGGPEMADLVGVPAATWAHYEAGVTIPGEVLLAFIDEASIEPRWLLTGHGVCYRDRPVRDGANP